MGNVLISVVVPIYKVEKYLKRCVDSIINQTYNDLEIILVDDGSPDNCPEICDEYAKTDKRIKVIHKENGGQAEARNFGIDSANGQYIAFVDSDDFIRSDYIFKLYNLCLEYHCQISQCGIEQGGNDYFSNINKQIIINKYNAKELLLSPKRKFSVSPCDKLYRIELFKDVKFPVGKKYEDDYTTYKLVYLANDIVITNQKLYYYYNNFNSIMRNKADYINLDFIDAYNERIEFFKQKDERALVDNSIKELCIRLMTGYIRCKSDKNNKNDTKEIRRLYNEKFRILKISEIAVLEKTALIIFRVCPNLTAFLDNTFNIRLKFKSRRNR